MLTGFGPAASKTAICEAFFLAYNREHRHSGIGLHAPASVHFGKPPCQVPLGGGGPAVQPPGPHHLTHLPQRPSRSAPSDSPPSTGPTPCTRTASPADPGLTGAWSAVNCGDYGKKTQARSGS